MCYLDIWFVQFDFPNEEGKPYKSSGGAMVWNEKLKREIPEGWYAENICKIANILAAERQVKLLMNIGIMELSLSSALLTVMGVFPKLRLQTI